MTSLLTFEELLEELESACTESRSTRKPIKIFKTLRALVFMLKEAGEIKGAKKDVFESFYSLLLEQTSPRARQIVHILNTYGVDEI